jgi:hypothetical protein
VQTAAFAPRRPALNRWWLALSLRAKGAVILTVPLGTLLVTTVASCVARSDGRQVSATAQQIASAAGNLADLAGDLETTAASMKDRY